MSFLEKYLPYVSYVYVDYMKAIYQCSSQFMLNFRNDKMIFHKTEEIDYDE